TREGYIKRTPMTSYRSQGRGRRGVASQRTKDDDVNTMLLVGSSHDFLLFFTNRARVYREKIYELPDFDRNARVRHIRNVPPQTRDDESVQTILAVKCFDTEGYFVFATRAGLIKRTAIREYGNINNAGLVAINLVDGDELVAVRVTDGTAVIVLGTSHGQEIRFVVLGSREIGWATMGVY